LKTYEGMFLFDSTFATDFERVEQEVRRVMERAGAEIVMCRKWDERKLAYEIKGHKRGCYVLTFFRADPNSITGMERDAQLSEPMLRLLVLRAEHMTIEDMEATYPSRPAATTRGPGEPQPQPTAQTPEKDRAGAEAEPGVTEEPDAEPDETEDAVAPVEVPVAAPATADAVEPDLQDAPDKID